MTSVHFGGCACPCCLAAPAAGQGHGAGQHLPGAEGATKPVYDKHGIVAALTTMGGAHASVAWNGSAVSYSIGTGALAPGHPEWDSEHGGYAAMTPAMGRAAAEAFELWDELIAISLVERPNDPFADVTFNYSSTTNNATYANYSYYMEGGRADRSMADVDIWFATGWWTHDEDRDLYQGGYGVFSYIHEIGHALGLSHPGRYDGSANFAADATHYQDTRAYTVMSYFDAHENGSGADHVGAAGRRYASTPLLNDILAAQSIYGPDMTTRTGATTYGFGSNAGHDAFDFVRNREPVIAIWDAGGIDEINVSGWDTDQRIDLTAGSFSSVGHLTHNLAIAHGTVIENAVGGGGGDDLSGNAAANVLRGGAGDDRLSGGAGNDRLEGGIGNDVLRGGPGADFMAGGRGDDVYEAVQAGDIVWEAGEPGSDRVFAYIDYRLPSGVEHLLMTFGSQIEGRGNALNNHIIGNGANNVIEGRAGYDVLTGGGGSDLFVARPGFAVDRILDFVPGAGTPDAVVFSSALFSSFAAVLAKAMQVGNGTWIGDGSGNTVVLDNVSLLALHADDFGFI